MPSAMRTGGRPTRGAQAADGSQRAPRRRRPPFLHTAGPDPCPRLHEGAPDDPANNHPIRHGRVAGIHNGIISNDEELFALHGIERDQPEMTVDSEMIFALVDADGTSPAVLEQLVGAMAAAWIDERSPDVAPRCPGHRPPAVARSGSPRGAVRLDPCRARGRRARTANDVPQDGGRGGPAAHARRRRPRRGAPWSPDRSYREADALPAVRAPQRGALLPRTPRRADRTGLTGGIGRAFGFRVRRPSRPCPPPRPPRGVAG